MDEHTAGTAPAHGGALVPAGVAQLLPAADGPDRDRPVYTTSVASELTGLHEQTLRKYDRRGLVRPARTDGGERRYSPRDVDRLLLVAHLTGQRGLNTAGVAAVLELAELLEDEREANRHLTETVRQLTARLRHRHGGPPADAPRRGRAGRTQPALAAPPRADGDRHQTTEQR